MYVYVCVIGDNWCVIAQIFSVVDKVLRVELVVKIAGAEKRVHQQLIELGFADVAEESYLSHVSYFRVSRCFLRVGATG